MSTVKSEILVKATAELTKEVQAQDLKAKNKNMKEVINESPEPCKCGRVQSGDGKDNGKDKT